MKPNEFTSQMDGLFPGEGLAYHRGNLAVDRSSGMFPAVVNELAKAAWEAMEAGQVDLAQKCVAPGVYLYCAIKRAPPHKKVIWTGCYDPRHLWVVPKKEAA